MMRDEPVDLRRAVQEEVGRDLADLTFTSAMQERVMARLHERPRSRLTWLYPASAAAAAVLLILVTTTSYFGTKEEAGPRELTTASAPPGAPAIASPSQDVAPATKRSDQDQTGTLSATSGGDPGPAKVDQIPEKLGKANAGITALDQGGNAYSKRARRPTGPQLVALPGEHAVVTLTSGAVTRVDQGGAPLWQVTLPASKQAEQVVTTPQGKLVVGASSTVLLLGPDGSMLESLQLTEPVLLIATGTNERLALVSEKAVYVRQSVGQHLVAIAEKNVSAASFTPDGLLILATADRLAAYDPSGTRRWLTSGEGGPLLVSPDGKAILWANTLYDQNGAQVTALDPAAGASAGGRGFLRWDGDQVKAFSWTGQPSWSWTAPATINSLFQGEGDRLWVVLETPEGTKLQGLQASTGRAVDKAKSLPGSPLEAIASDGYLYLRLPEGLTVIRQ